MYKVIVVGGKLRGKEFTLAEEDNIVGRDGSCNIIIEVDGVSKKHMCLTVTGDACYVQDMGSSNGTFVNGKIVKRATIKTGDKIALPNTIFQLVHVKEKKENRKTQCCKSGRTRRSSSSNHHHPLLI